MPQSMRWLLSGLDDRDDRTSRLFRRAQYDALAGQIRLLYLVIAIAASIAAVTHYGEAPAVLTVVIPTILVSLVLGRLIYWMKVGEHVADDDRIRKNLRLAVFLAVGISGTFTAWAIMLFSYGSLMHQAILSVFILISAFGCAFALAMLPMAAVAAMMSSGIPFAITLISLGQFHQGVIAAIFLLVSALAIQMVKRFHDGLYRTVAQHVQLMDKHDEVREAHSVAHGFAYSDSLTGLPNRRCFEKALTERLARQTDAAHMPFAVAMVDLDGFKPINDMYGHVGGDAVLRDIGRRLDGIVGTRGMVARFGGDEFGLLVDGLDEPDDILAYGKRLTRSIEKPVEVGGASGFVSGSIGFALPCGEGDTVQSLISQADSALYEAKARARGCSVIFHASYEESAKERAHFEQELRKAVRDDQLENVFQPIMSIGTGRILGFESLARWHHPELGQVSPGDFVPTAERIGLVGEMTANLFRKALRSARDWPGDTYLSFNLSAVDLVRSGTPLALMAIMAEEKYPPSRLVIEVTETAFVDEFAAARETLASLRDVGVRVALDDFGTCHSNFSYLQNIEFDLVKIDKSFIDQVCDNAKTRAIVKAMRDMCQTLDAVAVAEGIETRRQLDVVRELGCEAGQGYLFDRPMSAEKARGKVLEPEPAKLATV